MVYESINKTIYNNIRITTIDVCCNNLSNECQNITVLIFEMKLVLLTDKIF